MVDDAKPQEPDDDEPTLERQAEFRKAYEANWEVGRAPYQGTYFRTRGEVQWVLKQHDWSGAFDALESAKMGGALLYELDLSGLDFRDADFSGADLHACNLSGSNLSGADLSGASLRGADLAGTDLARANLSGADLTLARMAVRTVLADVTLGVHTTLADVVWNNTPLTRTNWEQVEELGDERRARTLAGKYGRELGFVQLTEYEAAVRANRQLAVALRAQGLSEYADHFAYRAQMLQRVVLCRQALLQQKGRRHGLWWRLRKLTAWFGSLLLDLIAGYGYRPLRSFLAYAAVILAFMGLYLLNSQFVAPHLSWNEALVLSISSFHGRGFFNPSISLGDTYAELAAAEAFIGLMIEITFIATFTQRFFAR